MFFHVVDFGKNINSQMRLAINSTKKLQMDNLESFDVILFNEQGHRLYGQLMLAGTLVRTSGVQQQYRRTVIDKTEKENKLFSEDGVQCLVLQPSSGGWRKGIVRFRLEFIPDQSSQEEEDGGEIHLLPLADDEFGSADI